MTLLISLDEQVKINSAHLNFASTTAGVLQEIFDKNGYRLGLEEYPSLLNNDIKPLVDKYIELEEHGLREKSIAFLKLACYVAIVGGLILSSFFGTVGLLPLGLIVAWFVMQIWMAYDVTQKVESIEIFNKERKENKFLVTGFILLALLPIAPLWEVYTRKERIEKAVLNGLSIKLKEAEQFFAQPPGKADVAYVECIRMMECAEEEAYQQAIQDLLRLRALCSVLNPS